MNRFDGFMLAGDVSYRGLGLLPDSLPEGRVRNRYGKGPFAKLMMPWLPNEAGVQPLQGFSGDFCGECGGSCGECQTIGLA